MNIPRKLIGKLIEVQWMDPAGGRGDIETLKRGRRALATWREVGWVHDVTDGVVILVQSYATNPGAEAPDEMEGGAIPEVLIESYHVCEWTKEEAS